MLGGTGVTPWAIGDITPGDNGTVTVNLSNNGSKDGVVTIWISNISNGEGANPESETGNTSEPGELGDYLILNVSGTNLSTTNFTLPAKIDNFPQSANDTKHIYITPLKAGSTLNLQWEWQLPPDTGNDIQGDNLSFTINYMLEELPSPSSPSQGGGGGGDSESITRVGITQTGPSGVFVGFTGNYTLIVKNIGTVALNDVVVTDCLPEILSYKSSAPAGTVTGNQISWNLGTVKAGETKQIVAILGGVKSGTAVNTVNVTTRKGVTSTDSLNVTVSDAPGATMSIVDTNDPVDVGDELGYNIQVTNHNGTADLHNLTITGLIPSQMIFLSATGASEFTVMGQEVRFSPIATLKPGENVQYQIRVKAIAAGSVVFNATMRSDEFGESIVDQEGTTVLSGQNVMSVWLISAILAVIAAAALVSYIVFIMLKRRKRRSRM